MASNASVAPTPSALPSKSEQAAVDGWMEVLNHRNARLDVPTVVAEVRQLMGACTLADLGKEVRKSVTDSTAVIRVAELLHDEGWLSVPVVDHATNTFLGTVDAVDILKWVVSTTPKGFNLQNLFQHFRTLEEKVVADVLRAFPCCTVAPLPTHTPLTDLLDQIQSDSRHRVPLQEDSTNDAKEVHLITQSSLIRWMDAMMVERKLPLFASSTVEKLKLGLRAPPTIKSTCTVLAAMKHTLEDVVCSALAVVSPQNGMIEGTFSAKDLRTIYKGEEPLLERVSDFLAHDPSPVCVCTPHTEMKEVITEMLRTHRHHVWVVDNSFVPVGCITATDILSLFFSDAGSKV
eukprot:NODE_548_length_1577_cov_85.089660_g398_i0.p1 GENE.NODE_548_length_1577_cov_85.089660_g398_i0~~NODE_548_length_1577_cov_85.089660_g398_i0.p1  ORF type:complete len:384 (+),score=122.84 NODE_548_length_1577_cov_85.089660_g398_i0:112-1152(+)